MIDHRCVWSESGQELEFLEVESPELSTLNLFRDSDGHATARKLHSSYTVETVSLLDLLEEHQAPKLIDYLSIDTEGSEYEVLRSFDFDRFRFQVITCEHNYTKARGSIFSLLTSNGYSRVLEDLSGFDDWYVSTK